VKKQSSFLFGVRFNALMVQKALALRRGPHLCIHTASTTKGGGSFGGAL